MLEELDCIFGIPTRRHAVTPLIMSGPTYLSWFIKRYVLFQLKVELEPLYHLEGFSGGTTVEYMGGH